MHPSTAQKLATWGRHAQARRLVQEVVRALGPTARVMPLKGALLGALGIKAPAERQIRDVDVLFDGAWMGDAVAALGRFGFRIQEVPWSHGDVALSHPDHENLWVDLHSVPMPLGFGRLTRAYLFGDARLDEQLFGVPVFVPTRLKIALHLIG